MNTKEWRERFQDLIIKKRGHCTLTEETLEDFISTLIEQVREETKKDIREKLKELPVGTFDSTPYLEKFINTNLK